MSLDKSRRESGRTKTMGTTISFMTAQDASYLARHSVGVRDSKWIQASCTAVEKYLHHTLLDAFVRKSIVEMKRNYTGILSHPNDDQ